jgi:hypothetical protein
MNQQLGQQLVTLAIEETPAIIDGLKSLFAKQNPGAPVPTSDEVIAAYNSAFVSSVAKDEAWLAVHPVQPF